MPLFPAKCTQCGANLEVDSTHEAAVCPVCATPFITEKAINLYRSTYVTNIAALNTNKVIFESSDSADNLFKAGEACIKQKDYEAAVLKFKEMSAKYPADSRSWYGLIRSLTNDFTTYQEFKEYSQHSQWEFYTKTMDNITKSTSKVNLKFCADLLNAYEKYCTTIADEIPETDNYNAVRNSVLHFAKGILIDHDKNIESKFNPIEKRYTSLKRQLQEIGASLSQRKLQNVREILNSSEILSWSCYREKYIQRIVKLYEEIKYAESEKQQMWNRLDIDYFNNIVKKFQRLQQN